MAAGFWYYGQSEDTAFHKTLAEIKSIKADYKRVDDLVASNISTVANCNLKVKELEQTVAKMRDELDVFRDQVADTREKQIRLREALAAKRPQVKMPSGPIQVEFVTSPTPPKSPHQKADPAVVKKVKKQLQELSK
jgi:septation ring formation regulator EzrA